MEHFLPKLVLLLPMAVLISFMVEICRSHIPQAMHCGENDNDILILNSSFWLECENGQLIQKYCNIQGNANYFTCVPTDVVVKKQHSYRSDPDVWKYVTPTFTDDTLTNPHCQRLNERFDNVMWLFSEKQDCLQDYELRNVHAELTPCKIKNRNVYFLFDDEEVSKCRDDGEVYLEKCVFKLPGDDQYWCMDIDTLINLFWGTEFEPEIKRRLRDRVNPCRGLYPEIELVSPDFRKKLTSCNAVPKTDNQATTAKPRPFSEIQIEDTTDPVTGKDLFPQYIDCRISANFGSMVIDKDAFWRECVNGRLVSTQCAFPDDAYNSKYGCVSNDNTLNKVHEYYERPHTTNLVLSSYMDTERTEIDCLVMATTWGKMMIKFKNDKKSECITLAGEVDHDAEDVWCKIKSKKVYALDAKNGWFTCKGGRLVFKKCVFKRGPEYFCLSKEKIDAVWKDKPQAKDGSFCEAFTKEASQIYPNYFNELEPCEREGTDSETSNVVNAEVKDDSKVKSEKTDTKTEEETDTETEEETDTETEEETDLIDTKPYPGGRFGRILIKRCKEEPVAADDNCFYKCGRPYMCKTSNGQCLDFRAVEQMFNDSHSGKNKYSRYTNGPWSIKKYRKILRGLAYEEQDEIYKGLNLHKSRTNTRMFKSLSEVYILSLEEDEEDYFARKPSVSIRVGKWVTNVFAEDVVPIVEKFAPFYDNYISSYFEACPEEEEEEEEVDDY